MLHIRIDDEPTNDKRRFACGIGPELPTGDVYFHNHEPPQRSAYYLHTHPGVEACPGCFPQGRPEFGTPISRLSGQLGHPGYEEFKRIAASWGYD